MQLILYHLHQLVLVLLLKVEKQIKSTLAELEYFESTLVLTENLTSEADINSVKAELRDGVLTITFEKEKVEAPKKIKVL